MSGGPRLAFIDYLKCCGMALIVYGHTAGWAPLAIFPPVYLKQLGVAFFLFALGYSLAREVRATAEVLFARLFDIYFFGLTAAVLVSAYWLAADGRWVASNYLPYLAGANVFFNQFPANPTTWYVGSYLHFLLLWAVVLRTVRVRPRMLVGALVVEILVRAMMLQYVGNYIAYMTLPNWISVFLLGYYMSQRQVIAAPGPAWVWAIGLVVCGYLWFAIAANAPLVRTFPLMRPVDPSVTSTVMVSCAISALYLGATSFAFATFSKLPAAAVVTFIARNTIVIFIAHMPIIFALLRVLPDRPDTLLWRTAILMIVSLPGLAVVSHVVRQIPLISSSRAWLHARLVPGGAVADRFAPVPGASRRTGTSPLDDGRKR
jgi:hypothetical protein